jgi:hypothetical protein
LSAVATTGLFASWILLSGIALEEKLVRCFNRKTEWLPPLLKLDDVVPVSSKSPMNLPVGSLQRILIRKAVAQNEIEGVGVDRSINRGVV